MLDYIIRAYKKGDGIKINSAFNKVFGENRTLDEWNWKFNPENNGSVIMIAVDNDGEVLAHFGGLKLTLHDDGEVNDFIHSLDSYSLKSREILKKRIFLKTYNEYCRVFGGPRPEAFPWHFGCIGGRHLKLGKLVMNYTDPVEIEYLYKELDNKLKPVLKFVPESIILRIWRKISNIDLKDVDDLWKRSKGRYKLSLVRDSGYMRNRYINHPSRQYFFFNIYDNGIMSAIAVLSYSNGVLKWVDLIWDGKNSEHLVSLDRKISRIAILLRAEKIEMWLNNDDKAKEILISRGMMEVENPYDLYIMSRSFVPEIDGYDYTKRLYFTMGDSDIF